MKKYLICLAVVMTVCAYARPVVVRYPGLIESAVGLVADTVGLVTGRTVVYDYGPGVVYRPPVQVAPAIYTPAPVVSYPAPVYQSVVPCPAPVYTPAPVVYPNYYNGGYYYNNYYNGGYYYRPPVYRGPVYYRGGPSYHYHNHHHHHRR